MADGYSTEDIRVAATFVAYELTKSLSAGLPLGDRTASATTIGELFTAIYKAVREAQKTS